MTAVSSASNSNSFLVSSSWDAWPCSRRRRGGRAQSPKAHTSPTTVSWLDLSFLLYSTTLFIFSRCDAAGFDMLTGLVGIALCHELQMHECFRMQVFIYTYAELKFVIDRPCYHEPRNFFFLFFLSCVVSSSCRCHLVSSWLLTDDSSTIIHFSPPVPSAQLTQPRKADRHIAKVTRCPYQAFFFPSICLHR